MHNNKSTAIFVAILLIALLNPSLLYAQQLLSLSDSLSMEAMLTLGLFFVMLWAFFAFMKRQKEVDLKREVRSAGNTAHRFSINDSDRPKRKDHAGKYKKRK